LTIKERISRLNHKEAKKVIFLPAKIITMENLLEHISNRDLTAFLTEWNDIKNDLDEVQKQELLTQLIAFHYDEKDFDFFRKVMDAIIEDKLNLDFHIEHWAPTFLSLSVHVVSQNLFDYLLSKGANINFIGDPYAFEDDEYVRNELKLEDRRYATCLDFARLKLQDMMSADYHYQRPDWSGIEASWAEIDPSEEMTVSKRFYAYLVEQSQYLYELIHLNQLITHIIKSGGKGYSELL
jgi:hypothetical protein